MGEAAVLMAEGCEEGETLIIVDILRRAGIVCHTFAVDARQARHDGEGRQEVFPGGEGL